MHGARQRLGRFFCGDADGFAGAHVDERRGHLSPVAEFQGALSETASGDHGYGVGCAAVDFYERDQTFPVFTARVFDTQLLESQHGQAHAQHLSGAQMAVGVFGFAKIFVEGEHLCFEHCSRVAMSLETRSGEDALQLDWRSWRSRGPSTPRALRFTRGMLRSG